MYVSDQLAQIEPGPGAAATVPPEAVASFANPQGLGFYKIAVAAGLTVWLLSRVIDDLWLKKDRSTKARRR